MRISTVAVVGGGAYFAFVELSLYRAIGCMRKIGNFKLEGGFGMREYQRICINSELGSL
jgi:hypothetical protein